MWKTILRRLLLVIPQAIILSVLIFLLAKMMSGDPLTKLTNPNQDPKAIETMRGATGLSDPWYGQHFRWIGNALHGDFGHSFIFKLPISTLIASRIGNTIALDTVSVMVTYLIAIPFGSIAGRYQNSWFDKMVVICNFFSFAVPLFISASVILSIFGYRLGWFPTSGTVTVGLTEGTWPYYLDKLKHLILSEVTQALLGIVVAIQYLRSEAIDVKSMDFVRTVRSKRMPTNKIFNRHIFRNAILPITSQLGYEITTLIAGPVAIEKIFIFPGIRKLFIDNIIQRNYSVIVALVLILGSATPIGTLISNTVMSIVDLRVRVQ